MGNLIFAMVYTVVSFVLGGWVGIAFAMTFAAGLLVMASGSSLEISMSIDNAVINSSILRTMNPFWRKNYLLFGMPIAVVGMRFLIPILIVAATAAITPWATVVLAIKDPRLYSQHLLAAKPFIQAFGITFLSLIVGDFFVAEDKDTHWLSFIEKPLSKMGGKPTHYAFSLIILVISTAIYTHTGAASHDIVKFMIAGLIGVVSYAVIKTISGYAEENAGTGSTSSGFAKFLMLEAIDASFSFDGVIGAFAITQNVFLIMLSLGVGAVWVRYLTVKMAESKAIGELKYLSHGAFWNITSLIAIMVVSIAYDLPSWLPGVAAILIIGASVAHSFIDKE